MSKVLDRAMATVIKKVSTTYIGNCVSVNPFMECEEVTRLPVVHSCTMMLGAPLAPLEVRPMRTYHWEPKKGAFIGQDGKPMEAVKGCSI